MYERPYISKHLQAHTHWKKWVPPQGDIADLIWKVKAEGEEE